MSDHKFNEKDTLLTDEDLGQIYGGGDKPQPVDCNGPVYTEIPQPYSNYVCNSFDRCAPGKKSCQICTHRDDCKCMVNMTPYSNKDSKE